MQTFKRGVVVAALLFSPMTLAQDLNSQLTAWFSQRLAGFSDEVVVTIRTSPNLLPSCEQPALSVSGSAKLWGNVNVLARCANETLSAGERAGHGKLRCCRRARRSG